MDGMGTIDADGISGVGVIALVLVGVGWTVATAAAVPQPASSIGLDQTAEDRSASPGGSLPLETTIDATGYEAPALALDLPGGWTIESQSAEGSATFKSSTSEWVWLSGGEYTVRYTARVPDDAGPGSHRIAAEASAIDPATGERVVQTTSSTVSVGEADTTERSEGATHPVDDHANDASDGADTVDTPAGGRVSPAERSVPSGDGGTAVTSAPRSPVPNDDGDPAGTTGTGSTTGEAVTSTVDTDGQPGFGGAVTVAVISAIVVFGVRFRS